MEVTIFTVFSNIEEDKDGAQLLAFPRLACLLTTSWLAFSNTF